MNSAVRTVPKPGEDRAFHPRRGDGTTGQVDVLHSCKAGACLCARRRGLEVMPMPLPCIRLSSLLIISIEAREELKANNETGYLLSTTIKC